MIYFPQVEIFWQRSSIVTYSLIHPGQIVFRENKSLEYSIGYYLFVPSAHNEVIINNITVTLLT